MSCFVLAACGGGSTETNSVAPTNNGLPYADDTTTLEDFPGQSGEVTVVAHYLDYASGAPQIIVERALLNVDAFQGEGPLVNIDPNMTITWNGETLTFVNGTAVDSSGKTWSAYIDTTGVASGTAGIYHYDYGTGTDAFDVEGVFAFGFQTDPAELAARNEVATYTGNWFGYGIVTDGADGIVQNEAIGGGQVVLFADFDLKTIAGEVTGSYDSFGRVDGLVTSIAFEGNSFATGFELTCGSGDVCRSDTVIGGAFFGASGGEISGAIGFDEERTSAGQTRRLVSSAGYTVMEAPTP